MIRFLWARKWMVRAAVSLNLLMMVAWPAQFSSASPLAGTTTAVSVDEQGRVGLYPSTQPAISASGRFVAFESDLLVSEDKSPDNDVYVHDRQTGQSELVSVASDGTLGNGWSHSPDVSGDGRYVVFASNATNLVAGDTNDDLDVFLHDRQTGGTERISVDSDGSEVIWDSNSPVIASDGRYVAFRSHGEFETGLVTEGYDLYLKDRQTGEVTLVSATYNSSRNLRNAEDPYISTNGDYILFWSAGTTFVEGDTNGANDVFFYDRQADQLSIMSVSSDGTQGNMDSEGASVTTDGRYVAFVSEASNLVAGDTNSKADIFLHDRQAGETSRISNGLAGEEADGNSMHPQISADGRSIVFTSSATNLVAGDANNRVDVFVYDRETGEIRLASLSTAGIQANEPSLLPDISADGQHIAFQSTADNLIAGDDNYGADDIFVRSLSELTTPSPTLSLNFNTGRPSSFFGVIGVGFPSGEPAVVNINGQIITDNLLPADNFGNYRFILDSINADSGFYTVRLILNSATSATNTSPTAINTSASASFTLIDEAPLRPQEGTGVVLQVPSGIAIAHQVFLPVVVR